MRDAVEHDFLRCIEVAQLAWPEFKERNSIYHLFTKHFRNTCIVAEAAGAIVAFVLGFRSQVDPTIGYIHLVCTLPDYQRRGIAKTLYKAIFERFQQLGCKRVRCIVDPENAGSLSFHNGLGFRPIFSGDRTRRGEVSATKDYNGPGIDMVEFERFL